MRIFLPLLQPYSEAILKTNTYANCTCDTYIFRRLCLFRKTILSYLLEQRRTLRKLFSIAFAQTKSQKQVLIGTTIGLHSRFRFFSKPSLVHSCQWFGKFYIPPIGLAESF